VVWPAVRPASLPSGLFPVIYIGAGMFYNRPVLPWCHPGLNAVPFRPRTRRSVNVVLLSILLLLCGDTEQNPGPGHPSSSTFNIGGLNICFAANKIGCIPDFIFDRQRDVLALCEIRFKPDDPPAVKTVSRVTITASCMRTGTFQGRIRLAVAMRSSIRTPSSSGHSHWPLHSHHIRRLNEDHVHFPVIHRCNCLPSTTNLAGQPLRRALRPADHHRQPNRPSSRTWCFQLSRRLTDRDRH
jgi:hypothetical protein